MNTKQKLAQNLEAALSAEFDSTVLCASVFFCHNMAPHGDDVRVETTDG